MPAAIEWDKIAQLLWAAPVAGLAVTVAFSLLMLGLGRAAEARRDGASGLATVYTGLAALAGIGFAAVVIYGVQVITTK
jgi:uncharacterized membrane protein